MWFGYPDCHFPSKGCRSSAFPLDNQRSSRIFWKGSQGFFLLLMCGFWPPSCCCGWGLGEKGLSSRVLLRSAARGARVTTNVHVRDVDLAGFNNLDERQLEVVAGLTQLACGSGRFWPVNFWPIHFLAIVFSQLILANPFLASPFFVLLCCGHQTGGTHTTARELQRAHLRVPGLQTPCLSCQIRSLSRTWLGERHAKLQDALMNGETAHVLELSSRLSEGAKRLMEITGDMCS